MDSARHFRAWKTFPRRHPVWTGLLGFVLVLLVAVVVMDWNWARRPIERIVTRTTGREFHIDGNLDVDFFPLEVDVQKIRMANARWSAEREMARAERVHMRVRFWPLLAGRATLPLLDVDGMRLHLERNDQGAGNWTFRDEPCKGGCRSRVRVLQLLARDGRVSFREPLLKTAVDLQVESAKPARAGALAPLVVRGSGTYRNAPFALRGQVDSPLALQNPRQPYRLDLSARAGEMRARVHGSLPEPLQMEDVAVDFELSGPDLAQLYQFAGIVLPTTPPFALQGDLVRHGNRYSYRGFSGKVGDSDIAGDAQIELGRERPRLTARLKSRVLDFDDLAGFVGGTPSSGDGETASAEQQRQAAARRASGKRLPSTPIRLDRLRSMDADVQLTAGRVISPRLPLETMNAHLKLVDGVMRIDPLDFGAAGGRLASKVRLDARAAPAKFQLDTSVQQLDLPKLMPRVEKLRESLGTIVGVIQFEGQGDSTATVMASANGSISVIMGEGRVSNLLLEIAGLDIAESLKFLIGKDRQITVRCAYADFGIEDGVAEARAVAFDTTDTALLVRGDIDFRDESLDLTLLPKPKDMSPLSIRTPLKIGGTLADPSFGLKGGPFLLRGGAVAALASIAPPLALLGLIETGKGKDTDCGRNLSSRELTSHQERDAQDDRKTVSGGTGPRASSAATISAR
jgi:uncharacterized protein involved in outer membrane biogenesis